MQDPSVPTQEELEEQYDSPLERLQLLGADDEAIAAFLDEIDVRGPRDREMLRELARPSPLARPERFDVRSPSRRSSRSRACAATATTAHGQARSSAPLRTPIRYLVELVARYVVVSHGKNVADEPAQPLLDARDAVGARLARPRAPAPARFDAQALVEITKGREIGVPTFVIGGLLIPAGSLVWRLASGTVREWWIALLVGAIGVAVGLLISWFVLRGAALASRRIRLSLTQPLAELWRSIGTAAARRRISRAASRSSRSRSRSASGSCCRCS